MTNVFHLSDVYSINCLRDVPQMKMAFFTAEVADGDCLSEQVEEGVREEKTREEEENSPVR